MATCNVNGMELHWEARGTGDPLLLVHGLGSSARDWEPQLPAFAARHRVIRFDLRGHGRSERPSAPYDMRDLACDARALLDHLDIDRCDVLGLSLGGMIAFQLALDAPDRVRKLVVVNSGPGAQSNDLRWQLAIAYRRLLMAVLPMDRLGASIGRRLFPKPEQVKLRNQFIERWVENDPDAYKHAVRAILSWSVVDRLDEVRCPVLVVSGDRDYTPVAWKQRYVNRLADAQLVVIPDSGHATPIDQPARFNRAVLEFLGTRGGPAPRASSKDDVVAGAVPSVYAV